jgi:hypothetical protein
MVAGAPREETGQLEPESASSADHAVLVVLIVP